MSSLKPMSKLEAVNLLLQNIGVDSINSLVDDKDADVSAALQTLHRVSRDVQTTGWLFNTEEDYVLSRNSSNEVTLPPNTLQVNLNEKHHFRDDIVERAGKLYNRKEHTYALSKDPHVDIVFFFEFDDMPSSARNYVALRASREFVSDVLPNEMGYQTVSSEERMAYAQFLRDQTRRRVNILNNKVYRNKHVQS